jgi:cytochrome c oxidase subunit 4
MNDKTADLPAKTGGYYVIYVLIAALIFLAIGVSFMGLGTSAIYFNLIIAGCQASLLAYYFMHLKGANNLTWVIVGAGLFWIVILFLFLLTDYVTRHMAAY